MTVLLFSRVLSLFSAALLGILLAAKMNKSEEMSESNRSGADMDSAFKTSFGESASDPSPCDPNRADDGGHLRYLYEKLRNLDLKGTVIVNEQTEMVVETAGHDSKEGDDGKGDDEETDRNGDWSETENGFKRINFVYPVRPEAEDCAFYMKTGCCKFGSNCKFNHPVRREDQASREKVKERKEDAENPSHITCKYYLGTGGCKYGKACRFNHSKVKTSETPAVELNFLGLPIRLGEKECPYYMCNGSCKFGADCKFNHPDPTAVGENDPPPVYGNGEAIASISSQASSTASWSSSRPINGTPYVPIKLSQTNRAPSRTTEWNRPQFFKASVYSPERSMNQTVAYLVNNQPSFQLQMPLDEFPERPGQPECRYYLKTGECKFGSECRYHHPKNRPPKQSLFALSDMGLPLRPGQNICTHFSRYGICKFGPACKFDHSTQPALESKLNSSTVEVSRVDINGTESDGWD